jgi:hypothetical protein
METISNHLNGAKVLLQSGNIKKMKEAISAMVHLIAVEKEIRVMGDELVKVRRQLAARSKELSELRRTTVRQSTPKKRVSLFIYLFIYLFM